MINIFSNCLFGHAPNPLIVRIKGVTHHECRRCQQDLGIVLAGQKFKARKVKTPKKRKSADVLKIARQA